MMRNQEGIHSIKVALLAERAVVEYSPALWTTEKIVSVRISIYSVTISF
jgi:Cu+-exporting ATPase